MDFRYGALYLFVYDQKGTGLAHGYDSSLIWKKLIFRSDIFGTFFVRKMIEVAQKGGDGLRMSGMMQPKSLMRKWSRRMVKSMF